MCVLVNGVVQEELANGVVRLPFGTEYSLRFRNKHSRHAVVRLRIDGEDISGGGYIVPAHGHIDVQRPVDKDAAFKFVSLSSPEAVEFGKNGPNLNKSKGVIEASFYLEKEIVWQQHSLLPFYNDSPWVSPDVDKKYFGPYQGSVLRSMNCQDTKLSFTTGVSSTSTPICMPINPEGCTVEGKSTGQSFTPKFINVEDTCTVLRICLQGKEQAREVKRPRFPSRNSRLTELEKENLELRERIARLENEALRAKLSSLEDKS
jgi:hypothetical protein